MSSCKFIEISLITQNLLNGIFHVYLFACLLILPSFSFGIMVQLDFIYARQVLYH